MAKVSRITLDFRSVRNQVQRQLFAGANLRIVARATAREAENQVLPDAADLMARHFGHTLSQIHGFLRSPNLTGINRGGFRRVGLSAFAGHRVVAKTPRSWSPLSKLYIAQSPRSRTFWRKTGKLLDHYQHAQANILSQRAQVNRVGGIQVRRTNVELTARVRLGTLPDPLGLIIGQAFAEGQHQFSLRTTGIGLNRNSIQRITFPEAQRPVISAIAARLGREMRTALRKLGRP